MRERTAAAVIAAHRLAPHPEGGYYREVHRSAATVGTPPGYPGARVAMTAILFLLPEDGFSALHRVRSEEAWIHLDGAPLELVLLRDGPVVHRLGADGGEERLVVVPPGVLQAARPIGGWSLVSCVVAPGFDFADFEIPGRGELLERHPAHRELILRFTR